MAHNAASHNPSKSLPIWFTWLLTKTSAASDPTGTASGPAPSISNDVSDAVQKASSTDATGQNKQGQDQLGNNEGQTVMGEAGKEKTAKESMEDPKGPS